MRKGSFLQIVAVVALTVATVLVVTIDDMAADQQDQKLKFEDYRKAIKDAFQVDIKNFKDQLRGGMADGKAITDYDLGQLLTGVEIEREHTSDRLTALEIAMDHLERIPDYNTRLCALERECVSDRLLQQ